MKNNLEISTEMKKVTYFNFTVFWKSFAVKEFYFDGDRIEKVMKKQNPERTAEKFSTH